MSSTLVDDPRDRAFERLYRRHVRDVYRFALALLRNPTDAEDVTQTTFLNAYRALQSGEEPRRPQSWLLTIAHNAARSRVRLAMRRPREVPLDEHAGHLVVPEDERANVRELVGALGRLPFNQRTAITMRELEGRSYPEIAETLGVTVPAVEALLVRARRTLRRHAAAIRGLTVAGLPRSLRKLLEHGEAAAGGAVGAGVAAKVAAVVVAGVVVGGLGPASVDAGPEGAQPVTQPAAMPRHSADVQAAQTPRLERRNAAIAVPARVRPAGSHGDPQAPRPLVEAPPAGAAPAGAAPKASAPAPAAVQAPAGAAPHEAHAAPVAAAVDDVVAFAADAAAALPPGPDLSAPLPSVAAPAPPPVSVPPVTVPPVPVQVPPPPVSLQPPPLPGDPKLPIGP